MTSGCIKYRASEPTKFPHQQKIKEQIAKEYEYSQREFLPGVQEDNILEEEVCFATSVVWKERKLSPREECS